MTGSSSDSRNTSFSPQDLEKRGETFQEQARIRAAQVDIDRFRTFDPKSSRGPDQPSVTWGPLHSLPRPIAPIPRPRRRVWVPEGPKNSWFQKNIGRFLFSREEGASEAPPPYEPPFAGLNLDHYDGDDSLSAILTARSRDLRAILGSKLKEVTSKIRPVGELLLGKEIKLIKEFREWRRERNRQVHEVAAAFPESSRAQQNITPYTFIIGFEDDSEHPNWRGKLVMEVEDPTKETSWLGPLDQDSPRWIWESYRLPDEWFEGWETPSMKFCQGQSKAFLMDVSEPLW